MKELNPNIENLIAKILSGEADNHETAIFESWLKENPANRNYYESLTKVYHLSDTINPKLVYDSDAAWKKLKHKMESSQQKDSIRTMRSSQLYIRIAAMLILIVGAAFGLYKVLYSEKQERVTIASAETIKEFKLPDSTSIVMNRSSQLSYEFSVEKRKVELKGEAFFSISKDKARPFIVTTSGLEIRDIGTAFNVKALDGSDSVIVVVESGMVMLRNANLETINAHNGEQVVYLKSNGNFIKSAILDSNVTSYRTKVFVFENASLETAIQKLNEVYGTQIECAGNIKNCRLTATFKNEKLDSILDILAETLNLKINRENNKISLEGDGCE